MEFSQAFRTITAETRPHTLCLGERVNPEEAIKKQLFSDKLCKFLLKKIKGKNQERTTEARRHLPPIESVSGSGKF